MRTTLRIVALLVFIIASNLAAWNVFAQSSVLTEDEYWKLVQDSRDTIARIKNASAEEQKQELGQLAAQWEALTEVEVNGHAVPVNYQYLAQLMRVDSPDLDMIDGLLASLLDAHQVFPSDIFTSADIDSLHSILARPEFQWAASKPNPITEWFQKIITEINRLLNKILGGAYNALNSDVTSVIMVILLIIVFIFVFRTLIIDFSREAKLNGENASDEPLTSEAAFAKAQELSRGGDFRSAVRYLYLSALLIMDERGVMRYDRSKTNREYLRSVSNSPELSKPLEEVIEVFDNVWYGYHSLEEETFKHYSDRVEELKEKKS